MLKMAREDHDQDDGWRFLSKTHMEGLRHDEQLDVHERTVVWSQSKQLRSVVETSISCEEVYDNLLYTFGGNSFVESFAKKLRKAEADVANAGTYHPFCHIGDLSATALMVKEIPFPWPFSQRYCCIVQDYVLVWHGKFHEV